MGWSHRVHQPLSVVGIGVLCAVALEAGCKDEQPLAPLTLPARPFLSEGDFTQTPTLAALQNQVVVFDLEPTGAGQGTAEDLSRYALESGRYRFCIEAGDPYLQALSLETTDGQSVVEVDASSGCRELQVGAGTYRLRLRHAGVTGAHRLAFVRRLDATPPVIGDGGVPAPGWWALAPDDPSGQGRAGRLRALPPPQNFADAGVYLAVEPIVADFSNQQIDDTGLFDFSHLGGGGESNPGLVPRIRAGPTPLDLTVILAGGPSALIADTAGVTIVNKFIFDPLQIVEIGPGRVQFQEKPFIDPSVGFFIDSEGIVRWTDKPPQIPYMNATVLLRTFFPGDPDYAQAVPREGEVALYHECGDTGPVTILARDVPDVSALSSPGFPLDQINLVKLGPNTALFVYQDPGYGGSGFYAQSDGCTGQVQAGSFQIKPLLPIFIATSSCPDCNLSGLNLSNVSVSGANLSGANLQRTTLNHTSLNAAVSLFWTDFSGATVSCSDFSGTDGGQVDLSITQFSTTTFDPDISSCRSNFSNTRVNDGYMSAAGLRLVNLTNAALFFPGSPAGFDLSGAFWPGATVTAGGPPFQGTRFDGATLAGTSFRQVDLQGAIFHGANLSGADLTGANLDGGQLQDAGFQGAILIDVTGFQTVASAGADFTGARFGGVGLVGAFLEEATLDGATFQAGTDLTGIRFRRSSLQNVDLSGGRKLYGAQFVQANLEAASLAGALLSGNPDGGSPSGAADFTGAHLKNVDLSNAKLQGTVFANANIYGSYVPISGEPSFPCETSPDAGTQCKQTPRTGFTCSCATLVGATMSRTNFSGAFLYGVDFRGSKTELENVDFTNAILVAADFDSASFQAPTFVGAFLQGANFTAVSLDDASFLNAYLDFEPNGNTMQVLLGGENTGFRGWEDPNQPVCVNMDYTKFVTQVPSTTSNTVCPDGNQYAGGCGLTHPRPNGNPAWKSPIAIDEATTPGYYSNDATYTNANQSATCNGNSANGDW